jgi:phosphomannomutase
MKAIYLFDMDGTLTPSRLPMTEDFAKKFSGFVDKNVVYIVSGSDIEKIKEQLPINIFSKVEGIFASMGNEFYKNGKEVFKRDFIDDPSLVSNLKTYRKNTKYPYQLYPNFIEMRCGAINFSVLGRDCPHAERLKYNQWDCVNNERKEIVLQLVKRYPNYDFSIGGNIGIDIVPKGCGKEQVADLLRQDYPDNKIIFIGDMMEIGGNDYLLAMRLKEIGNSEIIAVSDCESTIAILKEPLK